MNFKEKFLQTNNSNVNLDFMQQTFYWLTITTLITALVGGFLAINQIELSNMIIYGSLILSLILIFVISFFYEKIDYFTLAFLTILFGILEGIGISGILISSSLENIMLAFAGTAISFGGIAIYGYVTKKDFTNIGIYLLIGLISIIIISLINIFILKSGILEIILSIVGIIIFLFFTIYDIQVLKNMSNNGDKRLTMVFGISLYLNILNIFLNLLNLLNWFNNED